MKWFKRWGKEGNKKKYNKEYYSLEDLHVGMRVSVRSLMKIVKVPILLDIKTIIDDEEEIGYGVILGIGKTMEELGLEPGDVLTVYNVIDETLDYISIDE